MCMRPGVFLPEPKNTIVDVFSLDESEQSVYINYMHIGNGAIVQVYTIEYRKKLDESKEELLNYDLYRVTKTCLTTLPT